MRRLALAFALLSAAACAAPTDEPGPAPLEADAALATSTGDAIAQWNTIARPWDGRGWRVALGTPPHNAAGWTFAETKTIVVLPGQPARTLRITLLHEIGHARGLEHVSSGVMQGGEGVSGPSVTEFSPEDLAECRRVDACD